MIISVSVNTSATYIFLLLFYHLYLKISLPTERNHSLEKWLILGLGQEVYKMSMEYLAKKSAEVSRVSHGAECPG